jgi:hypothetical protein
MAGRGAPAVVAGDCVEPVGIACGRSRVRWRAGGEASRRDRRGRARAGGGLAESFSSPGEEETGGTGVEEVGSRAREEADRRWFPWSTDGSGGDWGRGRMRADGREEVGGNEEENEVGVEVWGVRGPAQCFAR